VEDPPIPRHQPPAAPTVANDGETPAAVATEWLVATLALAVGLVVSCWETLTSGFRLVQGDLGDTRLINFTLEHSYRWLSGMPLAEDLWSPPIFYPLQHVAFYTDLLLGVAPLYWPWRWLGASPETSYQLWMLSIWSLNFVAAYLLLRRGLRASTIGAAAGAYLFSFGSSIMVNIVHQQLAPRFFLLVSLAGLVAIFRPPGPSDSKARYWWASAAFWGGLVAQLYTAVYPLVFLLLAGAGAAVLVVSAGGLRRPALAALRRDATALVVTGFAAAVLSAPAALRYASTAEEVGLRSADRISYPRILSWFLTGRTNRIYGGLQTALDLGFDAKVSRNNGLGVITLATAAGGLWLGRRRWDVQLVVAGFAGLVILTLVLPGGWSPWLLVRHLLPPTAALRAVARVGLMTLFPAALGLAIVADRLAGARRWGIVALLLLFVVAEQSHRTPTYDKAANSQRIESTARRVPSEATAFLLVAAGTSWQGHMHDDAAWVALATGVPTINGRSGNAPRGWTLGRPAFRDEDGARELRAKVAAWARRNRLRTDSIALIEVDPTPR